MMFTRDFDHPLHSVRWVLSDWFQFLFENTVLSGGFASVLIKILFRISRVHQKSEENVDFTLYYKFSTLCIIPLYVADLITLLYTYQIYLLSCIHSVEICTILTTLYISPCEH